MSEVRRRCVFYVSGFDPKGAAHYHALYKEQAALQEKVNGLHIEVGPRRKLESGNSAWTLKAVDDGVPVETWYEFMRWDDIVRAHWPRSQWQLWRDILSTSWFNLRCGALWKMWKLSWPAGVALTLPIALLLAALVGVPVLSAVAAAITWAGAQSILAAAGAALVAGVLLVIAARKLEARYSMYWMMRSYTFTRLQALGRVPELQTRLDALAERITQRVLENVDDEVLVIGHSSGPLMAVAALARTLRRLENAAPPVRPMLSLLTLGQCIPILGLLPQAQGFRDELTLLATSEHLDHWIDFSAPPDGCCFALTDPLAACGVEVPSRRADRPKLLSPRFAQMFDAERYQMLKRDKFRMHFQYLMAAQRATDYDYFGITAGAAALANRFQKHLGIREFRELRLFWQAP